MRKLTLLLLLWVSAITAQVSNGNETYSDYGFRSDPAQLQIPSVSDWISTIGTDGTFGKILPVNITIPYTPINYSATSQALGAQIAGIDVRLGQIGQTTAGLTNRVWFTGDNTVVNAVTYFASNATSKGSTPSASPANVVNADNTKSYFTKDIISVLQPANSTSPPGTYAGQLSVMVDSDVAQERYTVEVYKTNSLGVPIASGITGAPVGNLGVTVVAILDSGLLDLAQNSVTNISVSGVLISTLTINANERIRYHVSAEKSGTAGGNVTFSVFYGSNYNSYYDVPVVQKTSTVVNDSGVAGLTASDALNSLNTNKENTANKQNSLATDGTGIKFPTVDAINAGVLHKTGDTFTTSVGFPPMLVQNVSSSNIEKRYLSPEATRLSNAYTTIVCWGDSLTQGAGSTGGLSYPTRLANATTYTVLNKGVGGETSTQIKDRMIADTGNYDKTVIIWAGRNNAGDTTTVKNDIATMVAALGHQRYLVMGVLNGDYSSEWNTGVTYPKIIGLNNSLSKIYGKRYIPIREILISMHDGSAQDLIDVSRDIVPTSLRSDNIHLNDNGYEIVEETAYQRLGIALGQEGYLQSKDFKGLFESYSPLHTYGNETYTGLKTSNNTSNTADNGLVFLNSGTGINANNIKATISSGGNLINGDVTAGGSLLYGNITGSSGFGVRLVNGGTGLRVDNYTTSNRGILLNIFNNSRGIDTQNGGTFSSYYSITTAGGTGFQAISPTGTAYLATVTGSAIGASFTSQSSSSLFRLDGLTGVTGNLFEVRSLGTNVSWFSSLGILNIPTFKFTSAPPISAGGHDILTVNTSTLLVEKIPSTTFAPNILTGFAPATGTILPTDTVLQGIQKLNGNITSKANVLDITFQKMFDNNVSGISSGQIISPNALNNSGLIFLVNNLESGGGMFSTLGDYSSSVGVKNGKINIYQNHDNGSDIFTTTISSDNPIADTSINFPAPASGNYKVSITLGIFTVATLPTPIGTAYAEVTDALAPTYMAIIVGGGSVVCPVFYNGTNWVAH